MTSLEEHWVGGFAGILLVTVCPPFDANLFHIFCSFSWRTAAILIVALPGDLCHLFLTHLCVYVHVQVDKLDC